MYSRNVKYIGRHLTITQYDINLNSRWPLPSKKNGVINSFAKDIHYGRN